jgi:Fe-S cluster biosynthesis and repair protein YggX
MLEQLRVKLQTQRIGVLIDNLEPALINGEFIESHQSYYVELLTVLAHPTVQSITLVTSRESLHEPGIMGLQTFQTYLLEGLKKKAWEKYFDSQNISINLNTLSEMYRAYGGNALAMQLLSSDIRKKTQGNLEVYWQHNRDDLLRLRSLKSLVKRQFNKLREDNRHAYNLLCRLGFYPERDVPFVPNVWLRCLLWDVPEKNRQQVIDDLCDRSLLKVSDQGYYLHPVIRAEAVYRLNFTPEGNREYLIFIKEQIDLLIAQDREIQNALSWISQKFNLVSKFYKKAAFRAFYLGCVLQFIFEFVPSIMDNQYKNIEIAYLLEKDFLTLCGKGTYEQACKAAQEAFYRESKELVNIVKNIIKLNKIRKIERSFEDIYKEAVEVYFRKGYEQNIEPFPKLDFMKIEIIAKLKFELIFTLELEDEEIKNLNKSGEFEQFRNDFIQATIKGYRKGHIEAKKHKPTIEQYKAGLLSQSKIIRLILETLSLNSDKINKKESIKK